MDKWYICIYTNKLKLEDIKKNVYRDSMISKNLLAQERIQTLNRSQAFSWYIRHCKCMSFGLKNKLTEASKQ